MSIDKSIRQYYSRGQLVRPGPGRPGYQGWSPGVSHSGAPSSGGGGGGGDRQAAQRAAREAERRAAAQQAAAQQAAAQQAAATIAGPIQGIIDRPKQIYKDPDPVTETVPGDVTFEPKKEIKSIGPSLHGGPKFDKKKAEITKLIRDQALEKMDYIPDDTTQLDLNKFGEGYETVKPDLRTEKETIEDWERSQDWDKVEDLSKRGYSSKEIQDAMEKGLSTKTDPRSIKTNLLSRGISSLRNLIPKTGLERSLLGGLKKSFVPTEGGMLDPKRIALNFAKNYAMKKLGLGALNPLLGIASMFGIDPMGWAMNKFSRKPVDMTAFNKLGLQADRVPTDPSERIASQGLTTAQKIAMGDVDLNKLITGDEFSDIKGHRAEVTRPQYNTLKALGQVGNVGGSAEEIKGMVPAGTFDSIRDSEWEQIFKGDKFKDIRQITANGGLINLYRNGGFSG